MPEECKITIDISQCSKEDLFSTIRHELRHAYQNEARKDYKKLIQRKLLASFIGMGNDELSNMSQQRLEYCKKMCKDAANYTQPSINYKAYSNNALEQDARNAGYIISGLIKGCNFREIFINNICEILRLN